VRGNRLPKILIFMGLGLFGSKVRTV